jgi:uncharacterized protein YneF (UPF0154 family)
VSQEAGLLWVVVVELAVVVGLLVGIWDATRRRR